MCFVKLETAFDPVPRGTLWEVLQEYGVGGPLLRVVRSLYEWSRSLVRIAGSKSDLFPVHVGFWQDLPFVTGSVHYFYGQKGLCFGSCWISSPFFVDDVVQDLQDVLERFAAECEAAGMRISTSKSKAIILNQKKGVLLPPGWGRAPASSGGV